MRIAKFALVVLGALMLVGAAPLNPTVTLRSTPAGAAPEDCYGGEITPTTPTAPSHITAEELREVPMPVALEAPPRADLRSQLRAANAAAMRGDREGFLSALDAAKRTLATYPTGAERSAALDVVRVYDDLARVWNYQHETPTGAFFDESSEIYPIVSGYRGYEQTIRPDTFTSGGRRIYPTSETREFLLREANMRLGKLGIGAPSTQIAERPRRRTPVPSTAVDIEDETKALPPITRRRTPSASSSGSSVRRSSPAPAASSSSSSPSRSSRRVASPSRRSTPAPVPPPPPPVADHEPTPVVTAPPVVTPPPAADTAPAAPVVDTASQTATTPATTTTTAADARPVQQPAAQTEGKGRNLLIPIILIVIGVGVLIVLFRASS